MKNFKSFLYDNKFIEALTEAIYRYTDIKVREI